MEYVYHTRVPNARSVTNRLYFIVLLDLPSSLYRGAYHLRGDICPCKSFEGTFIANPNSRPSRTIARIPPSTWGSVPSARPLPASPSQNTPAGAERSKRQAGWKEWPG